MRFPSVSRAICALVFILLPVAVRAQAASDFGTVSITARPANADVFVDGERWVSPEGTGPLLIQLTPGPHTISVRAPGFRSFSTVVDVRRGETTPINVILPAGASDRPPMRQPLPPAGAVHQVSRVSSEDGPVFAADFRVTELHHRTTGLAGFYGGYVFGGQLMLGGGVYTQLDNYYSEQLTYGGAVAEWRLFHNSPVGVTLHGLAGYGQSNLAVYPVDTRGRNDYYHGHYGVYEEFWVGEPEAQIVARFGGHIRLVGGVGYRFTSSDFSNLSGVSGSVSVQFGR